jgi:hypothetical protein
LGQVPGHSSAQRVVQLPERWFFRWLGQLVVVRQVLWRALQKEPFSD